MTNQVVTAHVGDSKTGNDGQQIYGRVKNLFLGN